MHADAAMDMEKPFGAYGWIICLSICFWSVSLFPSVSLFVCPEVKSARLPPKMEIETVKM